MSQNNYAKHYSKKDFTVESFRKDGQISSIEIDGHILIKRRDYQNIYYFCCQNERKKDLMCPAQCRVCLPITKDSKAEMMEEHSLVCQARKKKLDDDDDKLDDLGKKEIKKSRSQESLPSSPIKDDTDELINKEIYCIVSQEPEITEKELRTRLESKFNEKKLPKTKALDNKINAIRTKLGTTSLDYVWKKNKTEEGYPFLRSLATNVIKINGDDVQLTYIIWMSNFQMLRFRSADHIYVDGSFDIVPKGFKQLITILAEDPITKFGVPIAFFMLDSKTRPAYQLAFQGLYSIATSLGAVKLNLKTVTLDFEKNLSFAFHEIFN